MKILVVLALLIPVCAHAQDPSGLKGISHVSVLVENLGEGASKIGLTEDVIQTDVELRLRSAGLKVISVQEASKTTGGEYLYINVNVHTSALAANIRVSLNQNVRLARNQKQEVYEAFTWDSSGLMVRPSAREVRDSINDLVDQFLNAWLKENPC